MSSDLNIPKDLNTGADNSNTSQTSETAPAELALVVDELLNQLSAKFSNISTDLISKMDDMSQRLDRLEETIQSNAAGPKKEDSS